MKITDYDKVTGLVDNNVFLIDGENGTKGILASDVAVALIGLLSSQDFISGLDMGDLTQITEFASTDKILVGTATGNKAIAGSDALYAFLDAYVSPEQRRMIFRGKNLGTAFTAEQKTNIANGTFKGFFLGDYWVIGGKTWRIVDFNYWLNSGDTACTTPHLVIMPDSPLYNAKMNDSNITTGGYVGSLMYTANLADAKAAINSAFGSAYVLNHRELLVNAVTNGYPTAASWYDSTAELPNEIMMYGCYIAANFPVAAAGYPYTIDKQQLALMQAVPKFINPDRNYHQWLRDPVSAASFADVNYYGYAVYYGASNACGVRPVFGLHG